MTKIVVQPNASGTGTFTIAAPNSSNTPTLTLPDVTGTLLTSTGDGSSLTGVGKVLQVVSTVDTAQVTQNTTTFAEVSANWRLSITPQSATSKLILCAQFVENRSSGALATVSQAKFYDVTNSQDVFIGAAIGSRARTTITYRGSHEDNNDMDEHMLYAIVDSSTTTARTYTVYHRTEAAALVYFNASSVDGTVFQWTTPFIFTITEISA